MFDILTTLTLFAGFAFILVVGAWLGAGSSDSLAGLFAYQAMPARRQGVQEDDLPPFVFREARTAPTSANKAAASAAGRVYGANAA